VGKEKSCRANGKFCDGFMNQQKHGLRSCKSQLQNERPSPQKPITQRRPLYSSFFVGVISTSVAANTRD